MWSETPNLNASSPVYKPIFHSHLPLRPIENIKKIDYIEVLNSWQNTESKISEQFKENWIPTQAEQKPVKLFRQRTYSLVEGFLANGKISFANEKCLDVVRRTGCFKIKPIQYVNQVICQNYVNELCEANKSLGNKIDISRPTFNQKIACSVDENKYVNQLESFELTERHWAGTKIAGLADEWNEIALLSLECCLKALEIPSNKWYSASAGAVYDLGMHNLQFNSGVGHYGKLSSYYAPYYDMSYISVTDGIYQGLEININGAFHRVKPEPNYLLVNFGQALEILSKDSKKPFTSLKYKVNLGATTQSYNSMKLFLSPSLTGKIQTYREELMTLGNVEDFFKDSSKKSKLQNVSIQLNSTNQYVLPPQIPRGQQSNSSIWK
jgi:hypothetical protein